MPASTAVDHLVVMAASLAQGVQWCEATLGITPGPGGEHLLMGTHNRLFNIGSPQFPCAYFEIMAINSAAVTTGPTRTRRWFDMDDAALHAQVTQHGPRLVHFVARVTDAAAGVAALARLGMERGPLVPASRMTPAGLLSWHITVRDDGQRLFDGGLPTLIQWGQDPAAPHPTQAMPDSGVRLQALHMSHPQAETLNAAYAAIGLVDVGASPGPARLSARLRTPKGLVEIHS
jgi:hypothetical protein